MCVRLHVQCLCVHVASAICWWWWSKILLSVYSIFILSRVILYRHSNFNLTFDNNSYLYVNIKFKPVCWIDPSAHQEIYSFLSHIAFTMCDKVYSLRQFYSYNKRKIFCSVMISSRSTFPPVRIRESSFITSECKSLIFHDSRRLNWKIMSNFIFTFDKCCTRALIEKLVFI